MVSALHSAGDRPERDPYGAKLLKIKVTSSNGDEFNWSIKEDDQKAILFECGACGKRVNTIHAFATCARFATFE